MDKKRRDFLKIAGVTTLAGLGGTTVVDRLVSGSSPMQARAALEVDPAGHEDGEKTAAAEHGEETVKAGKRLGIVVDLRQFRKHPELLEKIMHACHAEHNVPNFPNKKDVVKWIWPTGFENAFPEHSTYHLDE
ncbi:MAG TPA: twin-arginine translocation signal domain-containing protein, partial [Desulfobulbus sp.]|nr:twin-arginine translocation signal domain-containing protein [Desulfobulbus sp.]